MPHAYIHLLIADINPTAKTHGSESLVIVMHGSVWGIRLLQLNGKWKRKTSAMQRGLNGLSEQALTRSFLLVQWGKGGTNSTTLPSSRVLLHPQAPVYPRETLSSLHLFQRIWRRTARIGFHMRPTRVEEEAASLLLLGVFFSSAFLLGPETAARSISNGSRSFPARLQKSHPCNATST